MKYEELEIEIICFEAADVITESPVDPSEEDFDTPPM